MLSILYQHPKSNVQTVIKADDENDLHCQVDDLVNKGSLLLIDHDMILGFYTLGYRNVRIDDVLVYEITEIPCENSSCNECDD